MRCRHLEHVGASHRYSVSDVLADAEPAHELRSLVMSVEDDDRDTSSPLMSGHEKTRLEPWRRLHRWDQFFA